MKGCMLLAFLMCLSVSGASISTITCAGGVATVNVANSLVAAQGFEISGSTVAAYNINGSAVAATPASFTFNVTCNGTATGGTFQPARQFLVTSIGVSGTGIVVTGLFWNTTTAPTACPGCTSLWSTITAAQLTAIKAGTAIESVQVFSLALSTTTSQMQAIVLTQYANVQALVGSGLTQFVNWCYDGTTWSATCN